MMSRTQLRILIGAVTTFIPAASARAQDRAKLTEDLVYAKRNLGKYRLAAESRVG